ncbi:hypothetical protein [uncultured Nostoc sp.]|uniref:hypothetical protein n=1 Tax=uncultured Nostoc sp. TaxID=340711 RepID=UPI002629F84D|nr:hypothetical protein [uncultured Nostoc sp.]
MLACSSPVKVFHEQVSFFYLQKLFRQPVYQFLPPGSTAFVIKQAGTPSQKMLNFFVAITALHQGQSPALSSSLFNSF